ncbi:MAG TPA: glycoside hydrolase family 1 protein [Verrucomicrobiae bacterium]|jgi:beta-glucosidase|nr:glycoside hydrolase family 1 protein [Verrucomicrobiae bacterium]
MTESKLFLWGAATSSHQVEGNNRNNDWWAFEKAGRVRTCSELACNQYELYRKDIEMIAKLGHNAHRFSIEWSRIEPEEGRWDESAFHHYEDMILEMRRFGIEPVVTLHHFTNPIWLAEKGGWLSPESPRYFKRYARKVAEVLGRHVTYWNTINEPVVYLFHGYCTGLWPPGKKTFPDAVKVFRHLLQGHVGAYEAMQQHYEEALGTRAMISIAKHLSDFTPCNPLSVKDRWFTFLRDWFFNHLFLQALTNGFLFFPGLFCEFISSRSTLDYIGVNYYTRHFVRAGGDAPTPLGSDCNEKHHPGESKEINAMGWEVYPEGFYRILMSLKQYGLPVLVCENGICAHEDEQRQAFIKSHLGALERAGKDGLDVMGFFYWSLLDNFEWADGFKPRFGLVEVDYATQARKVRQSAHVLAELCRNIKAF